MTGHDPWQEDWADNYRGNYETFIDVEAIRRLHNRMKGVLLALKELYPFLPDRSGISDAVGYQIVMLEGELTQQRTKG